VGSALQTRKMSSAYSSTLSWMYILPPFLFSCSRESA
jgi:hypothetical protein